MLDLRQRISIILCLCLSYFLNFLTHHHSPLTPLGEPGVAHAGYSVVEFALHNAPEVKMVIMTTIMMMTVTPHLRSSRLEKYPRSLVVPRILKMYSVLSRLTSRLRLWYGS